MAAFEYQALDARGQALDVGHQQVVAHDLKAVAEAFLHQDPGVPVILVQAVFDGDDGAFVHPILV